MMFELRDVQSFELSDWEAPKGTAWAEVPSVLWGVWPVVTSTPQSKRARDPSGVVRARFPSAQQWARHEERTGLCCLSLSWEHRLSITAACGPCSRLQQDVFRDVSWRGGHWEKMFSTAAQEVTLCWGQQEERLRWLMRGERLTVTVWLHPPPRPSGHLGSQGVQLSSPSKILTKHEPSKETFGC